jgi:Flp pilus assembly protein TadG
MVWKLAHLVRRMRSSPLLQRWRRDEAGATAVEFGVIALPFLMILFGILSVCLYHFTNFSLENAAWQAARAIRTGQLQQSQGSYAGAVTNADRKAAFKKAMCALAPPFIDCNNKVVVIVQSNTSFAGISAPKCSNGGVLVDDATAPFDTGSASSVVLITVCYPWSAGAKLPFFKMGNLDDGSLLMQSSVALRTEPYN